MSYKLLFTDQACRDLDKLQDDPSLKKHLKAVRKALGFLELNPRHPSLCTHKFKSITTLNGMNVFEAYAENKSSTAYRVFWHYGPDKDNITVIAITPHP